MKSKNACLPAGHGFCQRRIQRLYAKGVEVLKIRWLIAATDDSNTLSVFNEKQSTR